ncbi:hypothetical protein ACWZHB_22195 [Nocardia sp. FBN12]|uniref:hypothetical protein n=1 Tax=Nocardia sp. FBN12 TaxID=3419766 RepID=UPI003D012A58
MLQITSALVIAAATQFGIITAIGGLAGCAIADVGGLVLGIGFHNRINAPENQ